MNTSSDSVFKLLADVALQLLLDAFRSLVVALDSMPESDPNCGGGSGRGKCVFDSKSVTGESVCSDCRGGGGDTTLSDVIRSESDLGGDGTHGKLFLADLSKICFSCELFKVLSSESDNPCVYSDLGFDKVGVKLFFFF